MMPTTTTRMASDESDASALDEPIPELEAELDAVDHDGFETFLHAVRDLVHGPQESSLETDTDAIEAEVTEEDLGDWLPGVWTSEEPRGRRRAQRAERRNLRKSSRRPAEAAPQTDAAVLAGRLVPAQADAETRESLVRSEAGADAVASRRERRRERRREAARAIADAVPAVEIESAPATELLAESIGGDAAVATLTAKPSRARRSRRARTTDLAQDAQVAADAPGVEAPPADAEIVVATIGRRERREQKALAKAVARGESRDRGPEPESLAEYLARVEAPLLPRRTRRSRPRTPRWLRRSIRVTAIVAVIGACVALPWAAPAVPSMIADLVPDDGGAVTRVDDPPVLPSTEAFTGPIGLVQSGPLAAAPAHSAGQPREVRVPRLNVDSEVVPISGQSGSLLPPSDPQLLGWWREGRPVGAAEGSAVITGHTVHTGGGALDHLDQLVVGDSLRVRTDNGWIRYVVQRTHIYSTEDLARDAESIFRLTGPGRLVVITCDDWNGEFYESNAVVFATPVSDEPFDPDDVVEVPDAGPGDPSGGPSGNMDGARGVDLRDKLS